MRSGASLSRLQRKTASSEPSEDSLDRVLRWGAPAEDSLGGILRWRVVGEDALGAGLRRPLSVRSFEEPKTLPWYASASHTTLPFVRCCRTLLHDGRLVHPFARVASRYSARSYISKPMAPVSS